MNVREAVLKALAGAGRDGISGASLADSLGVSRNAVWKAVKVLQENGFDVESSSTGYRISPENNKLSAELIKSFLPDGDERVCEVYDSIDSTNNRAKELAASGAANGTFVAADMQTLGRGRLGRSFVSPAGKGLYMSVVIRPELSIEESSMITAAAACACASAVEKLSGHRTDIKWVNDLYMNGKKICGILTEASLGLEMRSLDYAVIGIGINVRSAGDDFDEQLRSIASSVEDETGKIINRNELCAEILSSLDLYLGKIHDRSFLDEYRSREVLTGHDITANVGNEAISAKAAGIDDNANLVVIMPDGTERHLSSGEANLVRCKQ